MEFFYDDLNKISFHKSGFKMIGANILFCEG